MDSATPRPQSAFASFSQRKKPPVTPLCIDTPVHHANDSLVPSSGNLASASTLSSGTSDETDSFIFPPPSRPRSRNMKKLSLNLSSAQSSTSSLFSPLTSEPPKQSEDAPALLAARRRPSILSLPNASTSSILHRKDEDGDGSPSAPYMGGPVQILPGVWLGNEDNARDWKGLMERGIRTILNVAKEVTTSFDSIRPPPTRAFMSTPDLSSTVAGPNSAPHYYPPHVPSGRPGMHYVKLAWSHGQADLVSQGFPAAMAFVDQTLERGDGILIHCQCGVSRSATLVIALVMRAAAQCSPNVPEEVWALKGMQGAYSYVKEKSKWVGPNMSLIYQLLDYERSLKGGDASPSTSDRSSIAADEEEWARRRQMVEDADMEDNDRESLEVMREAQALDKAMEHRRVTRQTSLSSMSSNGLGMGQAWRDKYGSSRKRTGSIASTGSFISEHLVEEEEEQELLGVGGGFTETSCSSAETEDESSSSNVFVDSESSASGNLLSDTPKARHRPPRIFPPSAPAHKASFDLPPMPATAIRTSFDLSTPKVKSKVKARRRPPPLVGLLPPVPSSPITPIQDERPIPTRTRTEGKKPDPPPAQLRKPSKLSSRSLYNKLPLSETPSQTLFVFPPSPTLASRTPSTMTLMSNSSLPFPSTVTPRVSTFKSEGRRKSFIGVGVPPTPTIAASRVDACGWIGAGKRA